jgi:hypothetical protein
MAQLKKSGNTTKGKKALEQEQASYDQRRAALNEQRQSLLVTLDDGKAPASTEPSAAPPAAKKPAKATPTDARKR